MIALKGHYGVINTALIPHMADEIYAAARRLIKSRRGASDDLREYKHLEEAELARRSWIRITRLGGRVCWGDERNISRLQAGCIVPSSIFVGPWSPFSNFKGKALRKEEAKWLC